MVNGGKLHEIFSPEMRNKTRCPLSPLLLHGGLDVLARVVRDGNKRDAARKRGQRILTVDAMDLYMRP